MRFKTQNQQTFAGNTIRSTLLDKVVKLEMTIVWPCIYAAF